MRRIVEARDMEVGEVIIEEMSGAKTKRPGLDRIMQGAHQGLFKYLIVWAIDRLGRNMAAVVDTITALDRLGVQVISYSEPWLDTRGPVRELLISIFAWVAQQERARLIERSLAGLETAKRKGVKLGRPTVTVDLDEALRLRKQGKSLRESAAILGVGVGTLQRALAAL